MLFLGRDKLCSLEDAVRTIRDGDTILCGGEFNARAPVATIREMIRQGKKNMRLVGHASGIIIDLACASGMVKEIQLTRLSFEREFGNAFNYRRAVEGGRIKSRDQCCGIINQQLRASGFGLDWMPVNPHIQYTDFMKFHPEWKLMDDPCYPGRKVMLVPKLSPDVYIVHVHKADPAGNFMIEHQGFNEELYSKAAERVIVTAEEIVTPEELKRGSGLVFPPHFNPNYPYFKVSHVVYVPFGAHPTHCYYYYTYDKQHIEEYQNYAHVSDEKFREYLDKYVYGCKTHADYLERIGGAERLNQLRDWRKTIRDLQRARPKESTVDSVTDYTIDELMVICLSRYVKDDMMCMHGGDSYLPMAALRFARLTHAPHMAYFGGVTGFLNPVPESLPEMANDIWYCNNVELAYEFVNLFDLCERGEMDLMYFGGAQIDKYGNCNACLLGGIDNIKVKLAGSGGTANMMGKIPNVILWTAAHERRGSGYTLVDKVDFISGHGNPPVGKQYPGEIGPKACVTDLGVFSFDEATGMMKLEALYPDITVQRVLENTEFVPIIPDKVPTVPPPTREEIDILRRVADPTGIRRKEFLPRQLERRFKL